MLGGKYGDDVALARRGNAEQERSMRLGAEYRFGKIGEVLSGCWVYESSDLMPGDGRDRTHRDYSVRRNLARDDRHWPQDIRVCSRTSGCRNLIQH